MRNPGEVSLSFIKSDETVVTMIKALGDPIMKYVEISKEALKSRIFKATLTVDNKKYRALVLNSTGDSTYFDAYLKENNFSPDVLLLISLKELGKWKASLYTAPGSSVKVNTIAEKYGGGGHPQAAGLFISSSDLENLLSPLK